MSDLGKVGFSSGRFKATYRDLGNPANSLDDTADERGVHYGAGIEIGRAHV